MYEDSVKNWKKIMSFGCKTQKTIDIISYGDWEFDLKKILKEEIFLSIEYIIE